MCVRECPCVGRVYYLLSPLYVDCSLSGDDFYNEDLNRGKWYTSAACNTHLSQTDGLMNGKWAVYRHHLSVVVLHHQQQSEGDETEGTQGVLTA